MTEPDGIRLMEYLDGTLPPAERAEVEAWLASDPQARELLEQHRATWALLGEACPHPEIEASDAFRRATVDRAREQGVTEGSRLRLRVTALVAASLLVSVVVYGWVDASRRGRIDGADQAVIARLDLLERLEFLDAHAADIDLAIGYEVLRSFDGEVRGDGR
jgi:anti-sigma factor RsiW